MVQNDGLISSSQTRGKISMGTNAKPLTMGRVKGQWTPTLLSFGLQHSAQMSQLSGDTAAGQTGAVSAFIGDRSEGCCLL
uniref:Uncharacterized protein n=1 Tax=Knipowitschia caucasica TaxID=637954 RepID=A0AAV2JQD9_KNICA